MNENFSAIMDKHEADDDNQTSDDDLFLEAIENEYSNGGEIIKIAKNLSLTAQDFFAGNFKDFPIIPIRQSKEFYIKKHTASQIPYFHDHDFFELIYVHKGECMQRFKRQEPLHMTKGACALISPKTVHLIEKPLSSDVILKAVIPFDLFKQTGGEIIGDISYDNVTVFDNISETGTFAILKLLENQTGNSPYKKILIKSYLTILFAELKDQQKSDIVTERLIEQYFRENIKTANLSEFAKQCGYNANYTSRSIKAKMGKTFSQLLDSYRIGKAKNLLTNTTMSVEEIADRIGYSNPSGFYKRFFSICGMTPSQYRNAVK